MTSSTLTNPAASIFNPYSMAPCLNKYERALESFTSWPSFLWNFFLSFSILILLLFL